MKKSILTLSIILLTSLSRAAFAEPSTDALPHVAIAGFSNKTGDASFDTPAATATESLILTITRLGAYEIVTSDSVPANATDAELLAWCQGASVDFVLYGSITAGKGGAQAYTLAVFDRAKGKTTIKKSEKGSSVFDVFSCADDLTFSVIDAIAGRHVGFGSVAFEVANPSKADGKAIVSLDGAKAGEGFGQIDRVVAGTHLVGVTWEATGAKPKEIALVEIEVTEGKCAAISVTIPETKQAQAKKAPLPSDAAKQGTNADDDMVFVEGGTFTMGSDTGPLSERPAHEVTVGSFWMGKTEVTQGEYKSLMGWTECSWFIQVKTGQEYPILIYEWWPIIDYCNARSVREGLTPAYEWKNGKVTWNRLANGYRLPTEAEWEYAAKGGVNHDEFIYPGSNDVTEIAIIWQTANGNGYATVGTKKPNSLGLYDMGGNVYERCWDVYTGYRNEGSLAKKNTPARTLRVIRGGDSLHGKDPVRCTARNYAMEDLHLQIPNEGGFDTSRNIGFRVVRSVVNEEQ
jgi:formylglycine-generating enzyme required for sulfatase activity/TolB-like protein